MQKIKCLFISLLCCNVFSLLQAQITITASDLPNENTRLPIAILDSVTIDPYNGSNNSQNWDWTVPLSIDVLTGDNTDYVAFGPVAGTTGEDEFVDSDFSRTSNLITILGFDIASFLPDANATAPVPADAYFSNDTNGDVYLDGLAADIQIDGIELGRRFLYADPPYRFYSTGSLGDSYTTSTSLVNDIYADELPIDVPIVSYFRLSLDVETTVEIDAFGELALPDSSFSVLRYNENSIIHAKLTPYINFSGAPVEFDPSLISDDLIESLGFDPNEIFFDTTFNSRLYRYYTKDADYPVASVNVIGDSEIVEGIEFYITPIELDAEFFSGPSVNACNLVYFLNKSVGLGATYDWDYGDGTQESFYGNSGFTEHTHQYSEEDVYTVTLIGTDVLGNVDTFVNTVNAICWAAGVEDVLTNQEYEVYPNPVSEVLSIKLSNSIEQNGVLSVLDITGKKIVEVAAKKGEKEFVLSLGELPKGTYFVNLSLKDGQSLMTNKILKL